MGRKAIRDLARTMLIKERTTLEGMRRAMRKLKVQPVTTPKPAPVVGLEVDLDVDAEVNATNGEGPA
jgi:hypothetical protein